MQKAGKYEILRKIGTGGFGVVYEGRDPFIKRRVAIKTCTSEDEEMRQRFFREAEIAGNLEQKNIVTIFDFRFEDGVPYLVQEYLPGEDLDHKITRRDPLTLPQRLEILLQVAQGLAYAHARGVIHRDIKPGNIRVLEDARVKIMDFGIAKLADVESGLTKAGMTVGTAAYLPPEQIRGDRVDSRADIFSFGVVAYELLAYQRPFDGKTLSTLLYQILSQEPVPIQELWLDCPPRLAKLVMRCLEKDAADRVPSFDAIVGELAAVLSESAGVEETLRIPQAERPAPAPPSEPEAEGLEAFAQRARAALDAGDHTMAELEITLAAKKFGEGPSFRRVIGPLKKEIAGRRERHEEERRRGERLRSLLERARSLHGQGSFEEARLALQAALEIEPAHAEARALIDSADRALQQAARQRERAADLDERRAKAERLLAAGELERAREALAAAQQEHGASALAELEQRLESAARERQLAALVAKARALLQAGEPAEAAEMARRALAVDGGSSAAREALAAAERELRRRADEAQRHRAEEERARQEDRARRRQDIEGAVGRGDFAGARQALAQAIVVHGAGDTFAALHERLLQAERAAQVAALVREAEARLHEEAAELAAEYARRALALDSASRDARDVLERAQGELRRRAAQAERERKVEAVRRELEPLLERQALDRAEKTLQRAERELGGEALAALRLRLFEARRAEQEERARREAAQRERVEAEAQTREAEKQRLAAEREAERARLAAAREAEKERLAAQREAVSQREIESKAREVEAARRRAEERAQEEVAALVAAGKLEKAEKALERGLAEHGELAPLLALRKQLGAAQSERAAAAARAELERSSLSRARALEAAAGTEIPSGSFASPGATRPRAMRWAIAAGAAAVVIAALVWALVGGGEPAPPASQLATQPPLPAPAVETPASEPPPSSPSGAVAVAPNEPAPPAAAVAPPTAVPPPAAPAVSPAAAFVSQGRERWTAGDREGALRAFSQAVQRDPQDGGARDALQTLERDARRQLATARRRALDGRAETLAPRAFADAESESARVATLRDPAQVARASWRAADLYADALREAESRAAQIAAQPPVAPPPATVEAPQQEPAPPIAPVQTAPVQTAPPLAPPDEREAVRAALRRYEAAYESLDVAALRAVWPALSDADARALGRAFAGYDRLQMTFATCEVEAQGAAATASCRVTQAIEVKVGSPLRSTQQVTFRLRKTAESWTILSRSVQ
jgi:serine/threonine-protein kinase